MNEWITEAPINDKRSLLSNAGVHGGLAVACWTASEGSEVQTPVRAGIWIEIYEFHPYSASGTTSPLLPEPVPSLKKLE